MSKKPLLLSALGVSLDFPGGGYRLPAGWVDSRHSRRVPNPQKQTSMAIPARGRLRRQAIRLHFVLGAVSCRRNDYHTSTFRPCHLGPTPCTTHSLVASNLGRLATFLAERPFFQSVKSPTGLGRVGTDRPRGAMRSVCPTLFPGAYYGDDPEYPMLSASTRHYIG